MELILTTKEDLKTLLMEANKEFLESLKEISKPKQYVSRSEAAKQLGVSTSMIDKLCYTEKLKKYRIGNKPVIKQSDIDKLIQLD